MGIRENVQAKKDFKEITQLVDSMECYDRTLELLRDWCLKRAPLPPSTHNFTPMTEEEAVAFSHTQMPYGDQRGMFIREINASYIQWLANQTFHNDLQRYAASEFFRRNCR